MKRNILMIVLLGGALVGGGALADDECNAPMSTWLPREAVAEKARAMGWHVRRIRTDDGCYKVYARDAEGRIVEAEFDPATLDLIELEIEDHQEPHEEEGAGHSNRERAGDGHQRDHRITPAPEATTGQDDTEED